MTTIHEDRAEEVGLRERKKQQTRVAIHEAAFRLIDEQGLEATTIEQICQEADVSSRTFFNYFPSKAAAALELPGLGIDDELLARFRTAEGSLVHALCEAVGASADRRPDHAAVKSLVMRHPDLLAIVSKMLVEVRDQFVALAAERADTSEQAELAVTLVMAAMGRVTHDENVLDVPLAIRLRESVDRMVEVAGIQMRPIVEES
ncbi:MAG TPA: TetR family transcriptional regulator [Galbitalea sp.]|nr:TetR family transcriptional regulator [Galbitalea sp.]